MANQLEHEHTTEAIRRRLSAGPGDHYLRDWIYGGIDGAVTTFAIVTGVMGAELSPAVVVILGLANLIGDGFSMAAGNYSGTRAEKDQWQHFRAVEQQHIELEPEGEREEIRQIYSKKGLEGEDLARIVDAICSDRDRWVKTMLSEEYGLPSSVRSPTLAALWTFSAFLVCGAIPLLPYLFALPRSFVISTGLTCLVFFAIGCVRSKWSISSWWRAGLETLFLGGVAAALAYLVGHALRGTVI